MDIVKLRRDLHQHPEVGFTEFRTASIVIEKLTELGYDVQFGREVMDADSRRGLPSKAQLADAEQRAIEDGANPEIVAKLTGGFTGVVAVRRNGEGPTIAFRFDMDALPIIENTEQDHVPFAQSFFSKYSGNMHACGHDGHTAIGLTFAEVMANADFNGTLKLIFQPAEEGGRGAVSMVNRGVVDDVNSLFCFHLGLDLPYGSMSGGTSNFLASTKLTAVFHGVSAHAAAAPEQGRNALLGAATALLNIHALPRFSTSTTRVNVGILEGGTAPNIIADTAKMVLECRADSYEVNQDIERRVRNILKNSAEMHGLTCDIEVIGEAATASCDEALVDLAMKSASELEDFKNILREHPLGASEDATFMMRRVQEMSGKATYMVLGTPIPAPHHNPKFDIGEEILPVAVELLKKIAEKSFS